MDLLPPALEQALIGSVLHQRMLECVGRLGRDAAPKNEFGLFKLLQDALEPRVIVTGHGSQQTMLKDTADASADLSHLL